MILLPNAIFGKLSPMRIGLTLLCLLWGATLVAFAIAKAIRGKVRDAAPLGMMALFGFLLAMGIWFSIGWWQGKLEEERRQAAVVRAPAEVTAPPAAPIEMRRTSRDIGNTATWPIGFLIAAIGLAFYPDLLRSRWLAYPVAAVLLVLATGMVFAVRGERRERFRADADGIEVRGWQATQRVAWKDVASVTMVEARRVSSTHTGGDFLSRHLSLRSKGGEELLRLEELAPPEEFRRFLNAIPGWTGHPVQEKTERR